MRKLLGWWWIAALSVAGCKDGDTKVNPIDFVQTTVAATPATGVVADGESASTVTVQVLNKDGAPIANVPVALAVSGDGVDVDDPPVTDAEGFSRTAVRSTRSGTKTVTVTLGPPNLSVELEEKPTIEFVAGAAYQLAFTRPPTNVQAGAAFSPVVQVAVVDAHGNVVPTNDTEITVGIEANPVSGTLEGTLVQTTAAGKASYSDLSIHISAYAGYSLFASATGLGKTVSQLFEVRAGPPAKLHFATQPTDAEAGVSLAPAVRVQLQDVYGNQTNSTAAVTLALAANSQDAVLSGTTVVNAVLGVASFSAVNVEKVGAGYSLVASSPGLTGDSSGDFDVSQSPPSAGSSTIEVSPAVVDADGASLAAIVVTLKDRFGNPVEGSNVSLSSSGTANTFFPSSGTTDEDGVFEATLVSTKAEAKVVSALVGSSFTITDGVTFRPTAVSASTSSVVASVSSATADNTASITLTVTARDAFNNLVPGADASLASSGTADTFTPSSGTTDASGVFTATFTSTKAEVKTVTATLDTVSVSTDVSFTPGAADATTSSLVASPSTVTADDSSLATLTVTVRDAYGNLVPARTVSLASTGTGYTLEQPAAVTDASGVTTGTIRSSVRGAVTVTATVSPEGIEIEEEAEVTFAPPAMVFTPCGQTGRLGPDQAACDTAYDGTDLDGKVTVTNGIQEWTVLETGTYRIEAFGAVGGSIGTTGGGKGARLAGDFDLTAGQVVRILVGQAGNAGDGSWNFYEAGGGGGSFVALGTTPLLVAGGGGSQGGCGDNRDSYSLGRDGQVTQDGLAGWGNYQEAGGVAGGTNGSGGLANTSSYPGGAGGGFSGSGAYGTRYDPGCSGDIFSGATGLDADQTRTAGGLSFLLGGAGGRGCYQASGFGGFGGGGGAGGCGGAGGGGYSGGGGGYDDGSGGGGGGSYNDGANPSNSAGVNEGTGKVTIQIQ